MGFLGDLFGTSNTSTSSIPKYLENSSKELLSKSKKLVAKDKYVAYKGNLVAGPNAYYTKAADAMKGQRDVADQRFGNAGRILDSTTAGTSDYYGGMADALGRTKSLDQNYFGKAQAAADEMDGDYFGDASNAIGGMKKLNTNYFEDAGNSVNNLRALSGDYFGDAANTLRGIDRGASTYGETDDLLDAGSSRFMDSMGGARDKLAMAGSRGGATSDAMRGYDSLGGIIGSAQGRAEDTQLGVGEGLRSTLGREMGESGSGYDESANMTKRAARLDSTNSKAIQDRMNPYTSAVTDNILRDYGKERQIAEKSLTDSARAAGAFGGSRHGVAQGMFDQDTFKGVSDISTAQREKAFNTATSRLDADRNNLLSSAGQLSGTQQARDAGTLGFTSQIGDLAARDANLIRQGGLDMAGATKDAASGKMAGERQLFDMDTTTAKALQDLGTTYSDESQRTAKAKLDSQAQRFGQDMSYQDREAALARDRLAQQGQQFNQDSSIADRKMDLGKNMLNQQGQEFDQSGQIADRQSGLARDRLAQQNQRYTQQSDVGKNLLGQQGQKFGQEMDMVSARDALAKGQLGQEQQRFGQNMTLADMQRALGVEDQKSKQAYAADLLGYGKETNALEQKRLDSKKAQWDEKQAYDYEQLNWLSSMISGQPYTRTTNQKTSNGIGNSLIGALTGGLGSFLSDENEKEGRKDADLEGILSSFRSMPVDDYDYKQRAIDAGMAPEGRRTGPMAQDWAKEFGGTGKDIDVAQMLGKMAGAIKGLEERTAAPQAKEEPKRGLPRRKAA